MINKFFYLSYLIIPLIILLLGINLSSQIFFLYLMVFFFISLFINPIVTFTKQSMIIFFFFFSIIVFSFLLSILFGEDINYIKPIFKFYSFLLIFIISLRFIEDLKINNKIKIKKTIKIIFYLILISSLITSIYSKFEEIRFASFYQEPSHFAIIFSPFLLNAFLNYRKKEKYIILFLCLSYNLISINITYLFVIAFCYLIDCFFNPNSNKFKILESILLTIILIIIYIIFFSQHEFHKYVLDRLSYTGSDYQFTLLVYLDGWERAFMSLKKYVYGSGFEQMGHIHLIGFFREKLIFAGFSELNRYDGSFYASKLIFEFGIIGIFLIIIYLYYFLKTLFFLKKNGNYLSEVDI